LPGTASHCPGRRRDGRGCCGAGRRRDRGGVGPEGGRDPWPV